MQTEQSYDRLVTAAAPALLRLAYLLTGNTPDAEDLLQDTLLATQRHAVAIAEMAAPTAYLRRALLNTFLSGRRRATRRPRLVALDADPPAAPVVPDRLGAVWQHLAALPPKQRATLVLRYYAGMPDHEIAATLGSSESTVRSNAARALATLRTHLAGIPREEM
ncbi:MAG: sigma-70 family RNA polymerase sigma factor [Dermatophilaceae bacterium]|nr:sigma-70 family RNA polymerase sigma factor [Tetrasphaera sp.]